MTRLSRISAATALTTLICGTPAMADITASDVWNSFSSFYHAVGLDVEASQNQTGDTLHIADMKITGEFPFDLGSITLTTTGFDLIENGDGTVEIKFPETLPLALALSLPDDLFVTASIEYRITDYHALASGDPKNIAIDYSMGAMTLELVDLIIPEISELELTFVITMEDIAGLTTYAAGDMFSVSQDFTAGKMVAEGNVNPNNLEYVTMDSQFSATMDSMKSSNTLVLPASGVDLMNLPAQLRDGLSFRGTSNVTNSSSRQLIKVDGEVFNDQKASVESASTAVSFSKNGLDIDSLYTNYNLDYIMQELPFPVQLNFAKVGGKASLPLLKSDEEQNFSYSFLMDGLTMADDIWSLFDPSGGLPRDPASMSIDLSGKGNLFVDLLDIDAMREVTEENIKFGELTALSFNNVDISAIGAQFTGDGAFTFDNTDLETFEGLPAPTGNATLNMSGLNAVMDTLIEIGLLENDAAFGMRMGLSLFTVAGDRKDTLTSKIEVTPDGHILANGKRLK